MRVAVNATITDTRSTGLGVYTMNVVRQLCAIDPSFVIFTSTPELFPLNGVSIRRVNRFVRPSYGLRGHAARMLWSHFQLRSILRKSDIDVLLSPTPLESIVNSPVPQVVVVHDLLPLFFPKQYPRQRHFFRYVLPRILRSANRIVADSRSTKEDLIDCYRLPDQKVDVVHIGCTHQVDRSRGETSVEPGQPRSGPRPYFLYVGNLYPHKNLHRLLESFAIAASSVPHELRIVGYHDRRFFGPLTEAARRLKVADRVRFLNYVTDDELRSLYASADVFVFPSLYEGFGIPPLEAMAYGVPVVASSTKALREVLGDAAHYADPDDSASIAAALILIAGNEKRRGELRERGFSQVEQYSWSRTARELYRIIQAASTATTDERR